MPKRILALAAVTLCAFAGPSLAADYKVLDYWGVGGYAHTSRPIANTYLDTLAKTLNFELTKTEDAKAFTTENLAQYRVVVLNNSTEMGKVLDTNQRAALMAFMKVKGVIAWHASGDVKGTWPAWTTYLGGELSSHGAGISTVRKDPAGLKHPIVAGLDTGRFDEEWYSYKTNPRLAPNVTVLYTMDEASCNNSCSPVMGDHPIVWVRNEPTGGRLFYSGMGHMDWIFQKVSLTRTMYKQAMEWAAATTVPIRQVTLSRSGDGMTIRSSGSTLEVELAGMGAHVLDIGTLDGRKIAVRSGAGPARYRFQDLEPSKVYTLIATTPEGREVRLSK
ncbi:MAG: glycosyl hydrolase [Fibrobacteres bacterium]|nr:glycosyl hydrolase [Fibrobacterota bacterium]